MDYFTKTKANKTEKKSPNRANKLKIDVGIPIMNEISIANFYFYFCHININDKIIYHR